MYITVYTWECNDRRNAGALSDLSAGSFSSDGNIATRPSCPDDMIRPSNHNSSKYAATAANSLLTGLSFVICVYNVPLRLQPVNGKGPLQAGLSLLALLCTSAISSVLGTALSIHQRLSGTHIYGWLSTYGSWEMSPFHCSL